MSNIYIFFKVPINDSTDGNTKCLIQSIFPVRETNKMCIDDLYFLLDFLLVVIYRSVLNWCDPTLTSMMHFTNSLRIPRGNQRPSINRRGTDNTMTKNKDEKRWFTKHNTETKAWTIRIPLKSGGELRCPGRVTSFCSTSGTRRVTLFANHVMNCQ
jgi:hypothetical protein